MANIMDLVKLRNKTSRNGFDLSRKNLFTAKVGELLPVSCIECLPGDSFDIDTAWFTRTQPVNTAAYTRMREYYDWYFVPTNLLWNKFNTFVTQMVDNNQKASGINQNVTLSDEHPYFTNYQLYDYLINLASEQKKNIFGFSRSKTSAKLLSYLDYGDFSNIGANQEVNYPASNVKLNPFPLLAYQKIYQDFFRNSQWEKAYSPACNIDYMTGASGTNNIPVNDIDINYDNMLDLRYCNWNKDYFMGLLPNSQYGSDSLVISTNEWNNRALDYSGNIIDVPEGTSFTTTLQNSISREFGFVAKSVTPNNYLVSDSYFSVLALRQAESLQKWREITQSQQQDYKSQIQAHFGEEVSEAYSDRCKYIGGTAGNLDIQPVQNTNITGTNDASIAGRGEGGNRGSIKFKTNVHGYMMCIYHAVPLLDYSIDGISRLNLKTYSTDYAIPEFDDIGMVQVPLVELSSHIWDNRDTILGYAPRYIDYKTSIDKVHGAFKDGGMDAWVAPISTDYVNEFLVNRQGNKLDYAFFKVPPTIVNTIFGLDATEDVSTDQLLVNCSFDIKAVRNLDRNGLPY